MKVQCDLCREIVVAELAIDGDRIAVRCPACKGRFTVETGAPPVAKAPAPALPLPPPPPAAPAVAAAWERCLSAWSDAAPHDELATIAAAHGAYAWVARAYRDRLRDHPDDAIATARLAGIQRITEASLRAAALVRPGGAANAAPGKPYRNTIAILVGLVLLAAAGTIYAMVTSPSEPTDTAPIPVQPRR